MLYYELKSISKTIISKNILETVFWLFRLTMRLHDYYCKSKQIWVISGESGQIVKSGDKFKNMKTLVSQS